MASNKANVLVLKMPCLVGCLPVKNTQTLVDVWQISEAKVLAML